MAPFDVVLTLGPASTSPDVIARLWRTARRFRLNGSHLTPAELTDWLVRLQGLFAEQGAPRPVVVDLQGAKMRVGGYPTVAEVPGRVHLRCTTTTSTDPAVIPIPHRRLFSTLQRGDELVLNDARLRLVVTSVAGDGALADVTRNGPLAAGKGVNRVHHPVPFDDVSSRDRAQIEAAANFSFASFALSFVHRGDEAAILRRLTDKPLAAKVERPEALDHLAAIADSFDEVWFCRGDLGSQAGMARLGPLQQRFEEAIPSLGRPAWLAGQVFEHLSHHPVPTRAEVVGLHQARMAHWAGIVLSDETAVGRHPALVADWLDELLNHQE